MQIFKCDICGKETYINPPTKPDIEEKEIEVPITIVDGVVKESKKEIQKIQKTTTIQKQNPFTGDIEAKEIPKLIDLKPRTVLIQLSAGFEVIKRDFCQECYKSHKIKKMVDSLWKTMANIESK